MGDKPRAERLEQLELGAVAAAAVLFFVVVVIYVWMAASISTPFNDLKQSGSASEQGRQLD